MEIAKGHTIDAGAAQRASPVRSHTTANTGVTRLADASAHKSLPTVSNGNEMENRENTQCLPVRRSAPPRVRSRTTSPLADTWAKSAR